MKLRSLAFVFLITVVLLTAGLAPVAAVQSDGRALVKIAWRSHEDLERIKATGVPVYATLATTGEPYLLAGATPQEIEALQAQGLDVIVLDPDMEGASYYLAYAMPSRLRPEWRTYGQLLLDDGVQVLLRITPKDAARLAEAGAELQAVTFDPKPLRPAVAEEAFPTVIDPDPIIQDMMDQVSLDTVYNYTGDLSGEWPVDIGSAPYTIATRYTYSGTPIQKATEYAGEHLEDLGLPVEYHQWSGSTYPNVIGEITGQTNPDDIYIICAHIDDMPSGPIAPGADDNASGTTSVLVAADILSQYEWGCTLRFALWTGEEQGLLGSNVYAQRAYNQGENIVGVLNLDMIGWNTPASSPDIDLHARSTMPATMELAQLFADVVSAYGVPLYPEIVPLGSTASDHASFWNYGYTAILGIEDFSDFNPRYHTTGDLLQYLDMEYYTDFVKASVGTFAHMSDCLISGDQPPSVSIVDPANNDTVSGTHRVLVDAADDGTIANVALRVDRDPPVDITANFDGTYYYYDWDTTAYADGAHTLRARAFDDAGQGANSEVVSVTVDNGGQPPILYVYAIDMAGKQAGPRLSARAIVTIRDEPGLPVEGATVYGSWSGDYIGDDSGTTLANGRVRFLSGRVQGSSATFTFTVTDVVKDGYTYDPDSNNETSDTIVVP
jgi:hypothetical protein